MITVRTSDVFITIRTCGCGKHQIGTQCTFTHKFTCRDCDPELYRITNNSESQHAARVPEH